MSTDSGTAGPTADRVAEVEVDDDVKPGSAGSATGVHWSKSVIAAWATMQVANWTHRKSGKRIAGIGRAENEEIESGFRNPGSLVAGSVNASVAMSGLIVARILVERFIGQKMGEDAVYGFRNLLTNKSFDHFFRIRGD